MAFENLTDREKQVLFNLINYYITSADPVGSRVIANKFKMGVSSATIRNTLQDLEELGLLQQPHTSAGRVPTNHGYRFYVDYLLKPEALTDNEKDIIKDSILKEGRGIKEILGQTCRVLGEITNQLGVTIAPKFEEGVLKRLELIPINDERIMVIVVVKSGLARSVIIEIEASISETELREVEQVLNERLAGLALGDIRRTIMQRLSDVGGTGRLIKIMVDSKEKIWTDDHSTDIQFSGAENLVTQPEFSNPEQLGQLMKIIGNSGALSEFIETAQDEGLFVTIGRESRFDEIIDCSIVTSSYRVGNITGKVGVIGPTRMPYNKLVSVVEYTARAITDTLSGINK